MSTTAPPNTKPHASKKTPRVTLPRPSVMVAGIEVSMIKRMQLLANSDPGVISLAQGIPSFETPAHIAEGAKLAIDRHLVDKYTPGYGIHELREAIAEKVTRDNHIPTTSSEVMVTHGGIEALMAVFLALLEPEDDVIVLTPDYASHITQARITSNGRMPVCVALDEAADGWKLNSQRLEQALTPRAKAILICNPCNPTGKVYSTAELEEIVRIAKTHNLFIIADEMYEYFTFSGKKHVSIASLPGARERTISIFGFSKSYAMTGWRIGYVVADEQYIAELLKVHDSLVTCPAAVSQYAALAALQGPQGVIEEYRQEFERRCRVAQDGLAVSDRLQLTAPEGSYFAFVKVKGEIEDCDLAFRLLKEAKVAVVPGSAFGTGGESHIRISFGVEEERLREGISRLVNYIEQTPLSPLPF